MYHDGDAAARAALEYVEMGFTAIKQDPAGPYSFQGGRELSLHELAHGEYNVKRIREAVAIVPTILFGTHGQMTTSSAIRLARRLEPYSILWRFEEPCPPDQMDAIGRVARATSIPVATGERLTTKIEFHQALLAGIPILQPDIGRSGSIWKPKKSPRWRSRSMRRSRRTFIADRSHTPPPHTFRSSCPNFLILETIQTGFHDAIVDKPLRWEEGYLLAPTEPGLGFELNEQALLEHPYTPGGKLHLEMCQTPLDSANRKIATDLE